MEGEPDLEQPAIKNGPVLLQNVALTALGTQASGWFIRA